MLPLKIIEKSRLAIREASQKKKIQNVNFFQKGGGATPKFTFKKSLYTVKRGFKMDLFNTRMCFGKF